MKAHHFNMCNLLCRIFLILLVSKSTLHSCIRCSCYNCTLIVLNSEYQIKTQIFHLQTKEMLSKWSWIVFNFIVYVTTVPHKETLSEDEAKAFFELIELDYEDVCYNIANVQWSFIMSPSNKTLSIWVNILFKLHNNNLFIYKLSISIN